MATHIVYNVAEVRHLNHTAPVSLTKITFAVPINSILIVNTSTTANAYISFDGINELTMKPGSALAMDFSRLRFYWTRSDGGTGTLEVITGAEA